MARTFINDKTEHTQQEEVHPSVTMSFDPIVNIMVVGHAGYPHGGHHFEASI